MIPPVFVLFLASQNFWNFCSFVLDDKLSGDESDDQDGKGRVQVEQGERVLEIKNG